MEVLSGANAKRLPAAVRQMLRVQCDGDWSRVTVDEHGGFTVHNNPAMALRAITAGSGAAEPAPSHAPLTEPASPPGVSRRNKSPDAAALQELIGSQTPYRTGVTVVTQPPVPRQSPYLWSFDPDDVDWTCVDFDQPVVRLRDHLRHGLPAEVPFQYHPDVLAMWGVNFEMVDGAVRKPHRVEIRPESRDKKYVVLAFWRGDIMAVMGFRNPTNPMVIAVYTVSKLDPEVHHHVSTGGGGARKVKGLPTSVSAMLHAIRKRGAVVAEADMSAKVAEVKYKGNDLGKVTIVDNTPRTTIQSDYQRVIRRMHAIDQRPN